MFKARKEAMADTEKRKWENVWEVMAEKKIFKQKLQKCIIILFQTGKT